VNPDTHEYIKVTASTRDGVQQTKMFCEFSRIVISNEVERASYWPKVKYLCINVSIYICICPGHAMPLLCTCVTLIQYSLWHMYIL
jgi:hypothetical protein